MSTSSGASLVTEPRFEPPRPPEPMMAMLILSLRLRPRTIAGGAANAPIPAPASARPNWRRVGVNARRGSEERIDSLMGLALGWLTLFDNGSNLKAVPTG